MLDVIKDQHAKNSLNEIDAHVFNGDAFDDEECRTEFRRLMARWERRCKELDKIQEIETDQKTRRLKYKINFRKKDGDIIRKFDSFIIEGDCKKTIRKLAKEELNKRNIDWDNDHYWSEEIK